MTSVGTSKEAGCKEAGRKEAAGKMLPRRRLLVPKFCARRLSVGILSRGRWGVGAGGWVSGASSRTEPQIVFVQYGFNSSTY